MNERFFYPLTRPPVQPRAILCVDRDGALIEERHYLADPAGVAFTAGAVEALRQARAARVFVALVSNQAGLAKGKFGPDALEAVHQAVAAGSQGALDCAIYCPYHASGSVAEFAQDSDWRKPEIGMYRCLQAYYSLPDVPRFMIGDKQSDLDFGVGIGGTSYLVRTGYGHKTEATQPAERVFDTLADAVAHIVARLEDA